MTATTVIDLRSDTVTRPSPEMRQVMAEAEVGDDVLDGDPTTARLEARVAELLGKDAALFFPSGTQANQTGVGVSFPPGSELILEADAHLLHYEMGAVAGLWGVQVHPVATPDGLLRADLVAAAMRAGRYEPGTGGIAVENTHNRAGGAVLPLDDMRSIRELADAHGVPVHLDGARLWHAAVALDCAPAEIARFGTTVMVCLSKGLGCPVGSCLAGSLETMERAWIVRRRLGGAMRQSGILAAAGLHALEHNLARLADDHAAAQVLYERLADHPAIRVSRPQTNILMVDLLRHDAAEAVTKLEARGVRLVPFTGRRLRAVTHLDVTCDEVAHAGDIIAEALA